MPGPERVTTVEKKGLRREPRLVLLLERHVRVEGLPKPPKEHVLIMRAAKTRETVKALVNRPPVARRVDALRQSSPNETPAKPAPDGEALPEAAEEGQGEPVRR